MERFPKEIWWTITSFLTKAKFNEKISIHTISTFVQQHRMLQELQNHAYVIARRVILNREISLLETDARYLYYLPALLDRFPKHETMDGPQRFTDRVTSMKHFNQKSNQLLKIIGYYFHDTFYFIVQERLVHCIRFHDDF